VFHTHKARVPGADGVPDGKGHAQFLVTVKHKLGGRGRVGAMAREPTIEDVDALVGPATPHFAYQLRARVRALVRDLPEDHPVRKYGEEKMELLDRLGHATSKAEEGPLEPETRLGWETLPSHAPASDPLPRKNR
jgi:hypothetical protein